MQDEELKRFGDKETLNEDSGSGGSGRSVTTLSLFIRVKTLIATDR